MYLLSSYCIPRAMINQWLRMWKRQAGSCPRPISLSTLLTNTLDLEHGTFMRHCPWFDLVLLRSWASVFISSIKIMLLWCLVKALQIRSEQSVSQDRVSLVQLCLLLTLRHNCAVFCRSVLTFPLSTIPVTYPWGDKCWLVVRLYMKPIGFWIANMGLITKMKFLLETVTSSIALPWFVCLEL